VNQDCVHKTLGVCSIYWLMRNNHNFRTRHAVDAYGDFRTLWDTPIFESQNFVVIPTVGALVEGWLLVVPRIPVLSFAQLQKPLFSELDVFLRAIMPAIQSAYGSISLFEHGPAFKASAIGCGVDYAHLHLVPVDCDLLEGAKQIAPGIQWSRAETITDIRQHAKNANGYWFVQQSFDRGECFIGTSTKEKPVSQLFRKVIANQLGRPEDFDWKVYAGETEIAATIEKLSGSAILA